MNSELRTLLVNAIKSKISPDTKEVALLLSGGVDSLSLGFAANLLGLKVNAYTFMIDGYMSKDFHSARLASHIFNWGFNPVIVPTVNLKTDFLTLMSKYHCKKKTQVECTFPFMYLIPLIKEKHILSGIAADGHFGLSKKAMIHYIDTKEKFDGFRQDYFSSDNPAGQKQQLQLMKENSKVQIAPYLEKSVFDYFIRFDWKQINKPKQKYKTLTAFPEYFKRCSVRPHENLQLSAKIPSIFERLLSDDSINVNNRKRIMDLVRDYANK